MRRTAASLVLGSLLTLALPATPVHAYRLPRIVVIDGRGFGHGLGMSQWGARQLASSGESWREILTHYYRGVKFSSVSPRARIRVLLGRQQRLLAHSSGTVRINVGGRTVATTGRGARWVRLRAAGDVTIVERATYARGPWRIVRRAHGAVVLARATRPINLRLASGSRWYRGNIDVRRPSGSTLAVVNDLPLDEYLRGVVPREMPALWPAHALAAQVVAARTYAVRVQRAARARGAAWDICATTACQVYAGYAWQRYDGRFMPLEHRRVNAIIDNTDHRVLMHRGTPILAQYSSSSGGLTRAGSAAYLRPVADPDHRSPYHVWRARFSPTTVERAFPRIGDLRGIRVVRRDRRGAWGGRVRALDVVGTRRTVRVSGGTFAARLGLRSTWFTVLGRDASPRYRFARELRYGMSGFDVAELQKRLRSGGFFPRSSEITRYFGPVTRDALRKYQRARGLRVTGILDRRTRIRLNR